MKSILFVTWDGPQVTYLESLFLPIFRRLASSGIKFHILQFTWGDSLRIGAIQAACEEAEITYRAEIVWRRPVAVGGFLTALWGAWVIRKVIRKHDIDIVMPRSTLPALASMLALRDSTLPMIFDADGLPLDERVDFRGQSSSSLFFRILRDIEAQAVLRSAIVLTRTRRAIDILRARGGAGVLPGKFYVVSNGRDTARFSPGNERTRLKVREELNVPAKAPLLVYAGSLGAQYCISEMFAIFAAVRLKLPGAYFLVLTASPEQLTPFMEDLADEARALILTRRVAANMVPHYLASADVGLALRGKSFSMQGVAPIKLGEYLLCGLPVIVTAGIGNTDVISSESGYLLTDHNELDLGSAASWFAEVVVPQRDLFRKRCREDGLRNFSLEASADAYEKALSQVIR